MRNFFFVWCFLGPQQNEVDSCQEVSHLTDVCMLPFLKHMFEVLPAKNKLQLVIGVLALSCKDQHSQAAH